MTIEGKWEFVAQTPMGEQKSTADFVREGDGFGGMQSGAQGANPVTGGIISGDDVTWQTKVAVPFPITLTFSGTVSGDEMKGQLKAGSLGTFTFEGKRVS
ncbi:MAG: hypothetical protein CMK09_04885 [Ponticaulis sp.]|nr:hypothetical protein [Ponticaulis sp.]|tara:strand:+ start:20418 stop:20717 length:300 start_codon:yes stop_codon:yes gene_type:complete